MTSIGPTNLGPVQPLSTEETGSLDSSAVPTQPPTECAARATMGARTRVLASIGQGIEGLAVDGAAEIGEPLALPEGKVIVGSGDLAAATFAWLLETLGVEGEVTSFHPDRLRPDRSGEALALCEHDGETFQVLVQVDEAGQLTHASRLDVDLKDPANATCLRALNDITAGNRNANPSLAFALFLQARADGKDLPESAETALIALRRALPPGTSAPGPHPELNRLVNDGHLSSEEADSVGHLWSTYHFSARQETAFFSWIREVGPRAGVDVFAMEQLYQETFLSVGASTEGRTAAATAVLQALPDDMGAGQTDLKSLLGDLWLWLEKDELPELTSVIGQKVGASGFSAHMYEEHVARFGPTEEGEASTPAAETAFFSWIREVGPREGVDVFAIEQLYQETLQSAGASSEGRAAAVTAVLQALPDDMGAGQGTSPRLNLDSSISNLFRGLGDWLSPDELPRVTELMCQKIGFGASELAGREVAFEYRKGFGNMMLRIDPIFNALREAVQGAVEGDSAQLAQRLGKALADFNASLPPYLQARCSDSDFDHSGIASAVTQHLGISPSSEQHSSVQEAVSRAFRR